MRGPRPDHILDGFFSSDVDAVATAVSALLDPHSEHRSHGEVLPRYRRRAAKGRAAASEIGGLFCPVIFGPTVSLCCACGKTRGAAHRGVTCDGCGVLCDDPSLRTERFGHIVVPGAVHPLLFGAIGDALRLSAADVRAVAHCEASLVDGVVLHGEEREAYSTPPGHVALDAALAAHGDARLRTAAIVSALPVPPPGDRPHVAKLARTMRAPWSGPVNERIVDVIERAERMRRLEELDAPAIILFNESVLLQRAVEAMIDGVLHPPPVIVQWRGAPTVVPRCRRLAPRADTGTRALFWLDDGDLLVQRTDVFVAVRVDGGGETRRWASSLRAARRQRGRIVVCDEWLVSPESLEEGWLELVELTLLDLDRGWLDAVPPEVPAVVAFASDAGLCVLDAASGAELLPSPWADGDPGLLGWTRDGGFAWLGTPDDGSVLDVETGIPHVVPSPSAFDPVHDVPRVSLGAQRVEHSSDDVLRATGCTRIALTATGEWRFLAPHASGCDDVPAVVADEERALLVLDGPVVDGAFSPDGARVAVLLDGEIEEIAIVEVATARVVARFAAPS